MSGDYVTREEFDEFKKSVNDFFQDIPRIFNDYSKKIDPAIRLGIIAQALAYISLLNHKDRDRVILMLEDLFKKQQDSFLFSPVSDEELNAYRQHMADLIKSLRNKPR